MESWCRCCTKYHSTISSSTVFRCIWYWCTVQPTSIHPVNRSSICTSTSRKPTSTHTYYSTSSNTRQLSTCNVCGTTYSTKLYYITICTIHLPTITSSTAAHLGVV